MPMSETTKTTADTICEWLRAVADGQTEIELAVSGEPSAARGTGA
jgi:hypothetical protein